MKRLVIAILILLPFAARAQQVVPPGYVLVDSLVFTPLAAVDSTLEGSTIFNALRCHRQAVRGDTQRR